MKTMTFDMQQWHFFCVERINRAPKRIPEMQIRFMKKSYFKGDAFPLAFPVKGKEIARHWKLNGVVQLVNGDEYEFCFSSDSLITFSTLLKGAAQKWSDMMIDIAEGLEIKAIPCVAEVSV